jgi:formylglycine-generating enzyme required for sulfatase activity
VSEKIFIAKEKAMKKFRLFGGCIVALVLVFTGCDNPASSGGGSPTVSGVTVSPASESVAKGGSQTFTATVEGTNNPSQEVSWTVEGSSSIGTTISSSGALTVASNETATPLTVRATSKLDTGKSGTANVIITKIVTVNGLTFALCYVPATPAEGFQRDSNPANVSKITMGYWMGETEITQELFEAVMGSGVKPSYFTTNPEDGGADGWKKLPVEKVSWYDAIAFCNKLSIIDGKTPVYSVSAINWASLTYVSIPTSNDSTWNAATVDPSANGYRLPTEMEWMWAAMGATSGGATVSSAGYAKAFAGSNGSNNMGDYAWYDANSNNSTHRVGVKAANELGLKDMSGNVLEWCWDWYENTYPPGTLSNHKGAVSGSARVVRGNAWAWDAVYCIIDFRGKLDPESGRLDNDNQDMGFRIVCAE